MRLAYLLGLGILMLGMLRPDVALAAAMTARAGETVAISVGQQDGLARSNLTVTITAATGERLTYDPTSAVVQAVVVLFPDPVSRLAVDAARRPEGGAGGQTVVYLALPAALPAGVATVVITGPDGRAFTPVEIDVVAATASAGESAQDGLRAFERAEHRTVSFVGPTVFHSAQIVLGYEAGPERPIVVNPRPSVKNVTWVDDGSALRVLLTPTDGRTPASLDDLKFHVAGGIGGLRVIAVRAYDVNGAWIGGIEVDLR